jgi:hypothetical protein
VYGAAGNTITFGPWVTPAQNPTLLVDVMPGGSGGVSSSPAGISCELTCSATFASGATVTLTATPAPGYVFAQWSGACSGSSTSCQVVMSGTRSVFAQFAPVGGASFALNVVVSGPGSVSSAPAGITCGSSCSTAFANGTIVTLTAAPNAGATFAGWSGACAGSGTTCQVTMSAARNVAAAFAGSSQVALTVVGATGGTVTTVPTGIDCGTTCVAGFALNSSVSVVATPAPGYIFVGWSGACSGTNTCDLTMDASKTVSPAFSTVPAGQFALTVIDFGNGSIVSAPAGINCGFTCTSGFPSGTSVTLTAVAAPGNSFAGWGGACTGLGACVVLMDNAQAVTATFVPDSAPPGAQQVPTLSEWGLLLLIALMGVVGVAHRHRVRRA